MRMRRLLCGLILLLVLLLQACAGREAPTPREVCDRLAESGLLGAGVLYDSLASADDAAYLDPALLAALYARTDGSCDAEDIAAVALYLGSSAREHRELAVFACRGRDAAREVASLCRGRAALIADAVGTAPRILLYGETVVFLALPEPAEAEGLLDRIFK